MSKSIQYASLTDEEMIRQVLPEQPDHCFESLYNRYVSKVYRRCLSMTSDSEKAQDYTHDIFLKVFSKLGDFQERASFSTWLYAIAYNYCADQLRSNRRLSLTVLNESFDEPMPDTPEEQLHEETLLIMQQAIKMLSMDEQQLLKARYEEGMRIEAISQLYSLKPSAVKMRLKRSRDKIKRLCQEACR